MQKNKENSGDGTSLGLSEVKDTYKDVDDYISTFEPLLFEEVKAQVTQKREEEDGILLDYVLFFCLVPQKIREKRYKIFFVVVVPYISSTLVVEVIGSYFFLGIYRNHMV